MRALSSSHRKQLELSVLAGRRASESASRAAIEALGVFFDRRPEHLDGDQAVLRNGLRAKWRQLGGDPELLVEECAYEQWHRLLFARFLAENNLLLHPLFKAPVTLADCDELAGDLGEPDAWSVAARFAAEILPGIFRLDDPCVRLRLAPEGRDALERILDAIPPETFAADDALGWVYQYWQKDKKDEVNASERKIGGADIGPVTQLFTENYMVRFLLENSLGAWWAVRHPDSPLVKGFDYLRLDEDGRPAASSFDGWPDCVAEVTVMDPCCGSGHFLLEAFSMLWRMRAEEEDISPMDAQDAVLRNNIFGLDLDARCVQIAMFVIRLQSWKAGGGWRQLPIPNIACSGIPVKAPVEEWTALANGDQRLKNALERLHMLFVDAETLGSLIDPKRVAETSRSTHSQASVEDVDWSEIGPMLRNVLSRETVIRDDAVLNAALDITRAAELLSRQYTFVVTNVPFLTSANYTDRLARFLERYFYDARPNLGTAMLDRCASMVQLTGSVWAVCFSGWLSAGSYAPYRGALLRRSAPRFVVRFTSAGFSSPLWTFGLLLLGLSNTSNAGGGELAYLDLENERTAAGTSTALRSRELEMLPIGASFIGSELRFIAEQLGDEPLLSSVADGYVGLHVGDDVRFRRSFWEVESSTPDWRRFVTSPGGGHAWDGLDSVILWPRDGLDHDLNPQARVQGRPAWGHSGVVVRMTGDLPAALYSGELFSQNVSAIIPKNPDDLPAIFHFVRSPEYHRKIRVLDRALKVTTSTLLKAPIDLEYWRDVAAKAGPLPNPSSADPTQWLFGGRPEVSTAPLQVAVARLLAYRWPAQEEQDDLLAFADADGIVCLPSVAGEAPAAQRVQQLLAAAFGESWSPTHVGELLIQVGSRRKSVTDWLRDEFFKQHCAMFSNRPFVWHLWDGLRDGFSALVNYHRLDRRMLEKLTYTYLGQDWVERQRAGVRDEVAGAESRLSAAMALQRKLELILEGDKPCDIFVRWKDLHEQPVGWEPDLNDGVRLNVRPFVEAGVLRAPFNTHWKTDRGKNPDGSERLNDTHLTLAAKLDARKQASHT